MISSKVKDVTPFMVMDILARAQALEKEGKDVIHLEVGEPDFETPTSIKQAAIKGIEQGNTRYTHAMGLIELRKAIALKYKNDYGVNISIDQILVTSGTSPGMLLMMMATLEEDDEVILSNPHYSCYPNFIEAVGGKVVYVKTYPEDGFIYRIDNIKTAITNRTKAIFINSPSNPTGIVMDKIFLQDISQFEDLLIFSDEIYHGLVYKGDTHTILEYTDNAFVVNGFSKLYAMTGWRLGYVIFPKRFSKTMDRLHQNFMISANNFVQLGGLAALTETKNEISNMRAVYNQRRKYMIQRLQKIGFKIAVEPTGAFYVFADGREFIKDSYKEAIDILETVFVGVTPGVDFGSGGEGFLRFSYASSFENIEEGLNRIENYYKRNSKTTFKCFSDRIKGSF